MADLVSLPAGGARQTVERQDGHQIRLFGVPQVRVTCRCLYVAGGKTYPSLVSDDARFDVWELYNRLPHRASAGPFVPVDPDTGRPADPHTAVQA